MATQQVKVHKVSSRASALARRRATESRIHVRLLRGAKPYPCIRALTTSKYLPPAALERRRKQSRVIAPSSNSPIPSHSAYEAPNESSNPTIPQPGHQRQCPSIHPPTRSRSSASTAAAGTSCARCTRKSARKPRPTAHRTSRWVTPRSCVRLRVPQKGGSRASGEARTTRRRWKWRLGLRASAGLSGGGGRTISESGAKREEREGGRG